MFQILSQTNNDLYNSYAHFYKNLTRNFRKFEGLFEINSL